MSMTLNHPLDKIVSAIHRKGGEATLTGIKRSIAFFNQSGGVEKLRKCLDDLLENGTLTLRKDKGGNGQPIESYCLANSNISIPGNSSNPGNKSDNGMTITVSLDIRHKGLLDAILSFLNVNDSNSNENTTAVTADDDTDEFASPDLCEEDNVDDEEQYDDESVPF